MNCVLSFGDLRDDAVGAIGAVGLAGGKGASLARMSQAGLPVPPGFIVTSRAFDAVVETSGLRPRIETLLGALDVTDSMGLAAAADALQTLVLEAPLPALVETAIRREYAVLGPASPVAVRSSAVAEDGDTASFAGQQETFLNVVGADRLVSSVSACWASSFSERALFYRAQKGSLADVRMAVVVQRMVAAEKSGVMFTMDPVTRDPNRVVVEAVFGLGEGIVSGELTPNHYVLDRETGAIVEEIVAPQSVAIVCDPSGGTKTIALDHAVGSRRVVEAGDLEVLRSACGRRLRRQGRHDLRPPAGHVWHLSVGTVWLREARQHGHTSARV